MIEGLSKSQAQKNLKEYGYNQIQSLEKTTVGKVLWRQVKNNFIIFLLAAAFLVSLGVGKYTTSITVLMVILIVILVGFIQEYKAEKAIEELKKMLIPTSVVIREGEKMLLNSIEIVPGDIVVIVSGDRIPADGVLIEATELTVNEAPLTGESIAIKKTVLTDKNSDSSKVYMGTYVLSGKGILQVTHTGMNSSFGKIAKLISTAEKPLTLKVKINSIAKFMVFVAFISSMVLAGLILLQSPEVNNNVLLEILILVVALCVSAFPEGLPVVLITTLAAGAKRMSEKNAIVGRMSIIETLGEVSVICTDKTGTITTGEMTAVEIFDGERELIVEGVGYSPNGDITYQGRSLNVNEDLRLKLLLEACARCNDAEIKFDYSNNLTKTIGSPTEIALLILSKKKDIAKESLDGHRISEKPFSSETKMMTVMISQPEGEILYSKGAPERILSQCTKFVSNNKTTKLTEPRLLSIKTKQLEMSQRSLRTIAVAFKENKDEEKGGLVFLGLVGLSDPPRKEVKDSISQALNSGIKVLMVTGDHQETAIAIGKQVGLEGKALTGTDLDNLTDEELITLVDTVDIYSRVRPEHKIRIVKALKNKGYITAMTGDGVNDAPALKEAHVGIAMGKNGTDVSRSSADLILKDDNFSTIIEAIKEGRNIFNNIQKFVTYQLSCNVSQLLILLTGVLLAPILGWEIPILASIQILFMNLVTDNIPALTLGLNPMSGSVLSQRPRTNKKILTPKLILLLMVTALFMASLTVFSYFISHEIMQKPTDYSRTLALVSLILIMIATAFNFRSFKKLSLNRSLLINKYLALASVISILATILAIYTPAKIFFETTSIEITSWIIPISMCVLMFAINDIVKVFLKFSKD